MKKSSLAWIGLPLIIMFSLALLLGHFVVRGDLGEPFLRTVVYPRLHSVSGWFTDRKFELRGPQKPFNKIVIVTADEESIKKVGEGRWPWHRDVYARIYNRIGELGAKVIAGDAIGPE